MMEWNTSDISRGYLQYHLITRDKNYYYVNAIFSKNTHIHTMCAHVCVCVYIILYGYIVPYRKIKLIICFY